ncbi:MAG TPA: N(4)-(beta-N-acetylglucosaminyl)-L-asparaginase [Flavobacteriaceae bacterium]|nr:N(4)-(beta-N-acetylglucosaminyl)-L-asparaginase [Flavobacteriaceae bacterium]MCB9212243.1 N(4)-(beta-N-acetylglucosaminyl)-L-asparaginase [Alteromonas sp.]HPF10378.1 N(4)-(beta-N-acetylglucosaminyl)-L-asparaginase [Flavobacteriaceae bacterium]HQU20442.1 N(4)-(beta-N-acetylglucosaminyl)-L-asparaginase [Flavobacteriaceae bacterium]HQU64589.1 N(4)-(beta-N-acetylglucosaminyl)-L-asparaginase [Flavobacteriaceae bacterium]
MKRRKFIQRTSLSSLAVVTGASALACKENETNKASEGTIPITPHSIPLVVATWNVKDATQKAWEVLQKEGTALDAVEQGCGIEEANAEGQSVGLGGLPDRDGNVTLDACIMNKEGHYGAVVYLQHIKHAISVARKVMEETPHVILAGKGAEQFAVSQGFQKENLLTEASKKAWEAWKIKSEYQPIINIENHDTIGMLAIDKNGDLSGGCTTSGLAYKMAGRVGDSPIIGSGLFIDNEVGGATATGLGEEVLKTVGSFLIVELMRQGKSPQEACEEAIGRIVKKNPHFKEFQVGYVAVNKNGDIGFYSIHEGFSVSKIQDGTFENIPSDYFNKS